MEQNLVKELESALQACVVTFLCQGKTDASISNEEGINSCVDKFVQSARQLEGYFTKYQMYTMVNHPPDLIREDITKLREELARRMPS
ncbi:mediator of RNA polymerase II transcription subunit 28-like [Xenia sp. Carnegie-2017]|uniref:mediator of RNA polymerase II transcription subunit 28-like n=1 Tax=Xenia sp. Carnegie-2017 TaxID=2897299 RepID=UPI001F0481AC|nr:mediator of RNA polymerase II transcription subunit 28-like [Xenia sp. Carnegie-2017]